MSEVIDGNNLNKLSPANSFTDLDLQSKKARDEFRHNPVMMKHVRCRQTEINLVKWIKVSLVFTA